jgi:predicted cation transporter
LRYSALLFLEGNPGLTAELPAAWAALYLAVNSCIVSRAALADVPQSRALRRQIEAQAVEISSYAVGLASAWHCSVSCTVL